MNESDWICLMREDENFNKRFEDLLNEFIKKYNYDMLPEFVKKLSEEERDALWTKNLEAICSRDLPNP